jgi:hypothetical protein
MKKLDLNQMEFCIGGTECYDEGNGLMLGAATAGLITGGLIGFAVGGTLGLIGGTFMNMINC